MKIAYPLQSAANKQELINRKGYKRSSVSNLDTLDSTLSQTPTPGKLTIRLNFYWSMDVLA